MSKRQRWSVTTQYGVGLDGLTLNMGRSEAQYLHRLVVADNVNRGRGYGTMERDLESALTYLLRPSLHLAPDPPEAA